MPPRIDTCSWCKALNENEELDKEFVDNVHWSMGYYCKDCGRWEHLYYMSPSLQAKEVVLNRLPPGSPKYLRAFSKFKTKFDNLQIRLEGARWRGQRHTHGSL